MTRTRATYFDRDEVDRLVGVAYRELSTEYEARKQFVTPGLRGPIETRLELLRHVWSLMLDEVP